MYFLPFSHNVSTYLNHLSTIIQEVHLWIFTPHILDIHIRTIPLHQGKPLPKFTELHTESCEFVVQGYLSTVKFNLDIQMEV